MTEAKKLKAATAMVKANNAHVLNESIRVPAGA